jgi:hypothetical protein
LIVAVVACGPPEDVPVVECVANLLPGELVITELMANPAGEDAGGEWFEIYNATGAILSLEGAVLITSAADGSGERNHVIGDVRILPGEYLVFGNMQPDAVPGFADHGYGGDLELGDAGGRVAIECNVIVVDEVGYGSSKEGVSRALSSTVVPSAQDNDDATKWCDGITEYDAGNLGSPGRANDCSTEAGDGRCDDGGQQRLLVPLAAGDLVITEYMADPSAVLDGVGEWFEVYVSRDVDLNGMTMGRNPANGADAVLDSETCLRATAGSTLVFAKDIDATVNGGLPVVDYTFDFTLVNSNGGLFVGVGTTILDAITWASAVAGTSSNLDPDKFDTDTNDDPSYWCPGVDAYGDGDLGTPGAGNQQCQIVVPGSCDDNGIMRDIVYPQEGQIKITEYMANPNEVLDDNGEWFEIRADAEFDLNGLTLGREGKVVTVEVVECLRMMPGQYAVFARRADHLQNGGLMQVDALFNFDMVNSNGRLFVAVGDVVLHDILYPSTSPGSSASLDESDDTTWCTNTIDRYGPGDNTGTPGAPNPTCP